MVLRLWIIVLCGGVFVLRDNLEFIQAFSQGEHYFSYSLPSFLTPAFSS